MSVKTFMSVKAVRILTAHISLLFPIHSLTTGEKTTTLLVNQDTFLPT